MQSKQRAGLGVAAGIFVAFAAAGCTVESRAVAGVGVGADGNPIGFLQVCSEHIDGATVYQTDADHLGMWTIKPAANGFTTWSFANGGNGWKVSNPFVRLASGQSYTLYGWTEDSTSSADSVDFTLAELTKMKPGQVRYWSGHSDASGINDLEVTTTVADFKQHACDRYR